MASESSVETAVHQFVAEGGAVSQVVNVARGVKGSDGASGTATAL